MKKYIILVKLKKHQWPNLDLLDFYTTLCKWKPDWKDLAIQLLAEKDKDIHAWNPNPLWLHTYLDKPTEKEASQIKQGI